VLKRQEEIDLMGESIDGKTALFGECKYQNQLCGADILRELEQKASLFPGYHQKFYSLFSKSGFTRELLTIKEKRSDVLLVDLKMMYKA
jgi:hypothetical protein